MADNTIINDDQRQTLVPFVTEHYLHGRILDELGGVLSQVEPNNRVALFFEPIEISGKLRQHGINLRPADSSRSTHGFVVNLNSGPHFFSVSKSFNRQSHLRFQQETSLVSSSKI